MVNPKELKEYARVHKEENNAFRIFLKENAKGEELDAQFKKYHDQYFEQYDCNQCRNCCKQLKALFQGRELEELARNAQIMIEDILDVCDQVDYDAYQVMEDEDCPFLTEQGCIVEKCKPESCKGFPYTKEDNRKESLLGILSNLSICPVLYEIYEQLKKDYQFTYEK